MLLSRALLARVCDDQQTRLVLIPGVALAIWAVCVHTAAYLYESFVLGMWSGMLIPGLLGLIVFLKDRQSSAEAPGVQIKQPLNDWKPFPILASALLATLVIAPLAALYVFHDEVHLVGHFSIGSQIQNDIYPPRHLTFPEFELRYHYLFNTLCAAVGVMLRVSIDVAIDIVTISAWFYCWCLLWVLGIALTGRATGWIAAPLTLFGGGVPMLCETGHDGCAGCLTTGFCTVGESLINPPIVSYFFQHPWTIGLPLGLTAVGLFMQRRAEPNGWRFIALTLVFIPLASAQITLFASLIAAVLTAEILASFAGRDAWALRRSGAILGVALASVALASSLGGWFAPAMGGADAPSMLVLEAWVASGLLSSIKWLAASHGFSLLWGIIGLYFIPQLSQRILFALLIGGSLFVVNTLEHRITWDIVKFSAVTQIALSLAAAASISALAEKVQSSRLLSRVIAVGLCAACMLGGISFVGTFALAPDSLPERSYARSGTPLSDDDRAAATYLRNHVPAGVIVYRRSIDASNGYAQWAGLPVAWMDVRTQAFGFPKERLARRAWLTQSLPESIDAYIAERVLWLVLAPTDSRLAAHVERWRQEGRALDRAAFGELRIVELIP